MTARKAGELAAGGVWVTLRRLRDQWVLLVFAASVLFWARDVYDRFVDLPARVEALGAAVDELRADVSRLGAGEGAATVDRSSAPALPGVGHAIGDGRPGDVAAVGSAPVERARDCGDGGPAASAIDAGDRRHPVDIDPVRAPQTEGSQKLAFGVNVLPRTAVGRATFLVQLILECRSHRQVEASPGLPFRVPPR